MNDHQFNAQRAEELAKLRRVVDAATQRRAVMQTRALLARGDSATERNRISPARLTWYTDIIAGALADMVRDRLVPRTDAADPMTKDLVERWQGSETPADLLRPYDSWYTRNVIIDFELSFFRGVDKFFCYWLFDEKVLAKTNAAAELEKVAMDLTIEVNVVAVGAGLRWAIASTLTERDEFLAIAGSWERDMLAWPTEAEAAEQ